MLPLLFFVIKQRPTAFMESPSTLAPVMVRTGTNAKDASFSNLGANTSFFKTILRDFHTY